MLMTEKDAVWQNPELVTKFLQNVRGAVPLSIEQIEMMLQLIAAANEHGPRTFLDLGSGDGVLASAILDEYPQARGVVVEFSNPMLESARRQLHAHAHRVDFVLADFHQPDWTYKVAPLAPIDAIVSGFAIHHLYDTRKEVLYREIFDLLAAEGVFINIEHVSSAIRWTESVWDDCMIDAIFGQDLKASPGKKRAEVAREYYLRVSGDEGIVAPLEVQLDWLREAGFENVDCYLKVQELALFGGQRPS